MNYVSRTETNYDHFLDFLCAHAKFLLSWRVWRRSFLTRPLGFRVIFEKPSFIACYDPIKKMWFTFEPFKDFCQHFLSTRFFLSSFKFFLTIFAQIFLALKYCVTIWWTVHLLIFILSAIIRIVKRRS
jgi:hypothetical protein